MRARKFIAVKGLIKASAINFGSFARLTQNRRIMLSPVIQTNDKYTPCPGVITPGMKCLPVTVDGQYITGTGLGGG
jgi:hypothetical protein